VTHFSEVFIIYNPKSTGNSRANAKKLERKLKKILGGVSVSCIPTEYAGHAEELARQIVSSHKRPLIVSSSGDGGYHEVINGAMQNGRKRSSAVCAVLPAGNANDHSRTMQTRPLWQSIKSGNVAHIDLLKVEIITPAGTTTRYAHSYAGIGLTPAVAKELNRHTLTPLKEIKLVLTTLLNYQPLTIKRKGKTIILDSLIFSNINKMAKFLKLAKENHPDDGLFEIVTFPHKRKALLLKHLIKAATTGLKTTRQASEYEFEVLENIPMQLDGEITNLRAGASIRVTVANKALSTIV
jgi:diacylglycerol kinase (ATP)